MVLRPLIPPPSADAPVSAWQAVESVQKNPGSDCWLIAQPDHAALAGDIAAHLDPNLFPGLDSHLLQAISLHDQGWGPLDARALHGPSRPSSFIDETPATFIQAWTASIDRCQDIVPMAGVIVSRHFSRLADFRLRSRKDSPDDTRLLFGFLTAEDQRRRALLPGCSGSHPEYLTDVLQFCDILSLYLCCGSRLSVVFPQRFAGRDIRLQRLDSSGQAAVCRFSPSILGVSTELAVSARRWPDIGDARQFLFVLQ